MVTSDARITSRLPPPLVEESASDSAGTVVGRVLLVTPDLEASRRMARLLEGGGLCVVHLTSGASALAAVRTSSFSVVACDAGLADLHGATVLRRIRMVEPTLPVVLLAEEASSRSNRRATDLVAFRIVDKNDLHALSDAIGKALGLRRISDALARTTGLRRPSDDVARLTLELVSRRHCQ
jgi:CheY-like chemotaxis protein